MWRLMMIRKLIVTRIESASIDIAPIMPIGVPGFALADALAKVVVITTTACRFYPSYSQGETDKQYPLAFVSAMATALQSKSFTTWQASRSKCRNQKANKQTKIQLNYPPLHLERG